MCRNSIPVPTLSNNSTLFRFETVKNNVFTSQDTRKDEDYCHMQCDTIQCVALNMSEEHAASVSRAEIQASHSRSEWHGRFISSALKGITFYPEDRGSIFLQNVGKLPPMCQCHIS
jgi:hypothetical protein